MAQKVWDISLLENKFLIDLNNTLLELVGRLIKIRLCGHLIFNLT